jgi:hypothetical protein
MTDPLVLGIGTCYLHNGPITFDPESITTVWIDPQTNLPPDVDANAKPITPDPEAMDRLVQRPICDPCVAKVNRRLAAEGRPTWETSATYRMGPG